MKKESLSGKQVVVTGGSRGIGKHIARAFLHADAKVIITGRHDETLQATAAELGKNCVPTVCNHRDPDAICIWAQRVLEEYGTPDILINNAGVMRFSPVIDMPQETWDEVMETNLRGTFLVTKAFLPSMIEKNAGDIFIISSMSGKKGDPGAAAYAASKFGLQGFAQALLYEVRQYNIRVSVLNPSTVNVDPDHSPHQDSGLHAADIAATLVGLACLPRRTLIRDMDLWATNP